MDEGEYMSDEMITQPLNIKLLLTRKPEELKVNPKCFNDINGVSATKIQILRHLLRKFAGSLGTKKSWRK